MDVHNFKRPQTFNNYLGFERFLWQRKQVLFQPFQKEGFVLFENHRSRLRSVTGSEAEPVNRACHSCDKS
jgi:hypothetical protein